MHEVFSFVGLMFEIRNRWNDLIIGKKNVIIKSDFCVEYELDLLSSRSSRLLLYNLFFNLLILFYPCTNTPQSSSIHLSPEPPRTSSSGTRPGHLTTIKILTLYLALAQKSRQLIAAATGSCIALKNTGMNLRSLLQRSDVVSIQGIVHFQVHKLGKYVLKLTLPQITESCTDVVSICA